MPVSWFRGRTVFGDDAIPFLERLDALPVLDRRWEGSERCGCPLRALHRIEQAGVAENDCRCDEGHYMKAWAGGRSRGAEPLIPCAQLSVGAALFDGDWTDESALAAGTRPGEGLAPGSEVPASRPPVVRRPWRWLAAFLRVAEVLERDEAWHGMKRIQAATAGGPSPGRETPAPGSTNHRRPARCS